MVVIEISKYKKSADCGQPIFCAFCLLTFGARCGIMVREGEIRPTIVEIAGILKKSSTFQFFPSIFFVSASGGFFPKLSTPRGQCYVNPLEAIGTPRAVPICDPNLLKGPSRNETDRAPIGKPHMENFSVESEAACAPTKSRKPHMADLYV